MRICLSIMLMEFLLLLVVGAKLIGSIVGVSEGSHESHVSIQKYFIFFTKSLRISYPALRSRLRSELWLHSNILQIFNKKTKRPFFFFMISSHGLATDTPPLSRFFGFWRGGICRILKKSSSYENLSKNTTVNRFKTASKPENFTIVYIIGKHIYERFFFHWKMLVT